MQRAYRLLLAMLLILTIGMSFAKAADLVPCLDGDNVATTTDQASLPTFTSHRHAPAKADHCRIISPLASAMLPNPEAAAFVKKEGSSYFRWPNLMPTGIVPWPPHGPPRA